MHSYHSATFYPVGQGLFSSGEFLLNHDRQRSFRWIYDCGTSSSKPLLQTALDVFIARAHEAKPTVDVVAVSHFDKDHIAGLVSLLQRANVGTLLLPYIPLSERMALALASDVRQRSRLMHFLINPIEVLNGLPNVSIERIVFVPASNGEPPPDLFSVDRNPNIHR